MILDSNAKRLVIYFFYDAAGIVDGYIPYMLDDVVKNTTDLCVVVNGALNDTGKEIFSKYTDNLIVRENKGFDVWAYKEAMASYGWKKLAGYDEVVLMNFTMMGPVYPFAEMYGSMDKKDLDFWGITCFYKTDDDPFDTMKNGYIPDHIQSHFIAIRKSLLTTKDFHEYWDKMPMITGYLDSVSRHEARFTPHFAEKGYKWAVYADADDYRSLSHQPAVAMARKMVEEKRCPIFKRRSFMQDYNVVLNESAGEEALLLLDYLKNDTDYPVELIWDNLLRVENLADLKRNLHWNYILSAEHAAKEVSKDIKIALVMHIYFGDLIDSCASYAMAMPDGTDMFITTNSEEKKTEIIEKFGRFCTGKLDVRVVPNKGRDIGPFLVEFRDHIDDYDYICHAHDKKAGQARPGTIGTSFAYKCFENTLASKEYVANVINTFETNDRLGLLAPPPPNHGDYYITLGLEWGANFETTKALCKELGINAPMNAKKEPIAPLGSYYFARTKAIKSVLKNKEWNYEDFPKEPAAEDGTILHAIERIYPFAAQSAGYYSGWMLCDRGAAIEITNYNHMIKSLNDIIFFKGMDAGSYQETKANLTSSYDYANEMKRRSGSALHSEAKIYYKKSGEDFNENSTILTVPSVNGDMFEYDFNFKTPVLIKSIRFDPCEYGNAIVKSCHITVTKEDGSKKEVTLNKVKHNGVMLSGALMYLLDDPWMLFDLDKESEVTNIHVLMDISKKITDEDMAKLQDKLNNKRLRSLAKKWLRRG